MMKRNYLILTFLVVIFSVSVLAGSLRKVGVEREEQAKEVLSVQNEAEKEIKLTIDFGESKVEEVVPYEAGQTILNTLERVTKEKGIKLEIKQYDFGAMVNSINKVEGNSKKAWMFYINGKLADKGADATILSPGDLVEWKYQSF